MFPLSLSLGLIYSTSIHAGVILAFLPLATAILASFYFKQKASLGFWVCAFIGCILIVIYILIHGHEENKKLESVSNGIIKRWDGRKLIPFSLHQIQQPRKHQTNQ